MTQYEIYFDNEFTEDILYEYARTLIYTDGTSETGHFGYYYEKKI